MKARTPHWDIVEVKALAAKGQLVLSRTRAVDFFETADVAVATAKQVIAGLTVSRFAETLVQPARCDVYGVQVGEGGWYLKVTIDRDPQDELVVISLHPLEKPLKTNSGMVKP